MFYGILFLPLLTPLKSDLERSFRTQSSEAMCLTRRGSRYLGRKKIKLASALQSIFLLVLKIRGG